LFLSALSFQQSAFSTQQLAVSGQLSAHSEWTKLMFLLAISYELSALSNQLKPVG
jgi:hypothetical protein